MNSLHWQRWDPFRELHREVGRLIVSLDPFQSVRRVQAYPPLNVHDAGDRYLLSMRLPGMTPADIELTITGETLTIRGERKRPEGIKDDSYRRQERPMGRWVRTITLPERVETTQVAAVVCRRDSYREFAESGERQAAPDHRDGGRTGRLSECRPATIDDRDHEISNERGVMKR